MKPPRQSKPIFTKALLWASPALLLVLSFCLLDMPMVRGDGLGYYAWLDSLVRDGDLDLSNQYRQLQAIVHGQMYPLAGSGRVGSPYPFGSAFLWAPLYIVGLLAARVLPLERWSAFLIARNIALPGYECIGPLPGLLMTYATNLMALAAVYLGLDLARRRVGLSHATLAALGIAFGTPFLYYSTLEPTMAHLPGTLAVTLFFWLFFRYELDRPSAERPGLWLILGLLLGLAIVTRWQLLLVGLPCGVLLLMRRHWRSIGALCLGVLAVAWTMPVVWNSIYGRPLVVPASPDQPGAFLAAPRALLAIWLAPRHGLLTWSPVVAGALVGLVGAFRRERTAALLVAGILLLQSLACASVFDWWAGWSFGMRRMVEIYPLYVLGLGWLLGWLEERYQRRGRWAGALLLAATTLWSLGLMLLFHPGFIDPGEGTPLDAARFILHADWAAWVRLAGFYRHWLGL